MCSVCVTNKKYEEKNESLDHDKKTGNTTFHPKTNNYEYARNTHEYNTRWGELENPRYT